MAVIKQLIHVGLIALLGGCSAAARPPITAAPPAPAPAPAIAVEPAKPQSVAFHGGVSLWGEMPGQTTVAPVNASDNLWQVSFTREGSDFDVAIDPTGQRIAFASTRHRASADLYVKQVHGQTVTQITSDAGNDVMPAWSPDGSAIAFCSDRSGNFDLYIQRLDGGQPIQLTNDPAPELHPSFSPDGSQIIFCTLNQAGQWEIQVIDVAQPASRRIIGLGLFPSFSPTGDKIAFQRPRYRGTRLFGVWTIDYVNGEGLRPTEIAAASNAAVINPAWSPDGKRLAFATVVDPSDSDIARPAAAELWAVNVDGAGRVKLTNDTFANLQPAWSRDGTIYFISNRTGSDNVWALKPASGTFIAQRSSEPAVAPAAAAPAPAPAPAPAAAKPNASAASTLLVPSAGPNHLPTVIRPVTPASQEPLGPVGIQPAAKPVGQPSAEVPTEN
jgi:Tol biopolymer transport system component